LQNASVVPPFPQQLRFRQSNSKLKFNITLLLANSLLWVDEKLAYARICMGTKRRLAVFHGVAGADFAEVSVSAGPTRFG